MFVIDTDTLTHYRKGHLTVVENVNARHKSELAATVITVEEQLGGWYAQLRKAKTADQLEHAYLRLAQVVEFFGSFPILPFPRSAIRQYESLLKMNLNVRKSDLRIGAIALDCGGIVVTANVRDFQRIPGIVCEDWTK